MFINVNNINLHYVEEGTGELVILLHGFPEFWYSWRNQIPVLSKKYRVVAPDMRGYNLSDKPAHVEDYCVPTLASDIAELIKKLGEKKAIIVGHDWGGIVAWAVASLYPEMVSKLVILNVPHPAEYKKSIFSFNLKQWMKSYYFFFFQLPWLPEKVILRNLPGLFKWLFTEFDPKVGAQVSDTVIAKYVEAYQQPGALTAAINYYRASVKKKSVYRAKGKLEMPVLLLWGEKDKALGKELTYNTSKYCSNLEIIYDPTSGHFIHQGNPQWVNEKLLEFISKK